MRYNLTVDDDIAVLIEKDANFLNVQPVEYIRRIIADKYGNSIPIDGKGFKILEPKVMVGFLVQVESINLFFVGQFSEWMDFSLEKILEIPFNFVDDMFVKKENSGAIVRFYPGSGTFTAIRLPSDEYLLCCVAGGVAGNEKTSGTLDPKFGDKKRKDWIVSGKFLTDFFNILT